MTAFLLDDSDDIEDAIRGEADEIDGLDRDEPPPEET